MWKQQSTLKMPVQALISLVMQQIVFRCFQVPKGMTDKC